MITKYGDMPDQQITSVKEYLRKSIFYLLLYVDPDERINYSDVNVDMAIQHVQDQLMGFNKILLEPPELLITMNYLEAAREEYKSPNFTFAKYRKLILDAGSKIMDVKEGDG